MASPQATVTKKTQLAGRQSTFSMPLWIILVIHTATSSSLATTPSTTIILTAFKVVNHIVLWGGTGVQYGTGGFGRLILFLRITTQQAKTVMMQEPSIINEGRNIFTTSHPVVAMAIIIHSHSSSLSCYFLFWATTTNGNIQMEGKTTEITQAIDSDDFKEMVFAIAKCHQIIGKHLWGHLIFCLLKG